MQTIADILHEGGFWTIVSLTFSLHALTTIALAHLPEPSNDEPADANTKESTDG